MLAFHNYKTFTVAAFLALGVMLQTPIASADMPDGRCMSTNDCYDGDPCSDDVCANSVDGCGDVNDDGTLSAPDALMICRAAVFLEECAVDVCDLDGNGIVTASDALVLMNVIVGIATDMVCMGDCHNDPMPASYGLDVIDFEGLPGGTIADEVLSDGGARIGVHGLNPNLGPAVNAAVIFDSSCPGGTCTGGDQDLGTPNEAFGGPGVGDGGSAGATGENSGGLGGVLIVSNNVTDNNGDDLVDNPGDLSHEIVMLEFDFSRLGGVSLYELTIMDVESNELTPNVKMYDATGSLMSQVDLPATGNNGVLIVPMPQNYGVYKAVVTLRGSGAIDNVVFSTDEVCW